MNRQMSKEKYVIILSKLKWGIQAVVMGATASLAPRSHNTGSPPPPPNQNALNDQNFRTKPTVSLVLLSFSISSHKSSRVNSN